jgi:hypothetical protein
MSWKLEKKHVGAHGRVRVEHGPIAALSAERVDRAEKLLNDVVLIEGARIDALDRGMADHGTNVDETALRAGRKGAAALLRAAAALLEEL